MGGVPSSARGSFKPSWIGLGQHDRRHLRPQEHRPEKEILMARRGDGIYQRVIMARSCLRCGGAVEGPNCSACTWPYAIGGWCLTTRRVRRITLDIGGVNAKRLNPHLNQLEAWQASGFVDLQRSKVFLKEFH